MFGTRADRIYEIIEKCGGRLKVSDIFQKLCELEGVSPDVLSQTVISPTVAADNRSRISSGKAKRFRIYGEKEEEHGYISIVEQAIPKVTEAKILSDYRIQIPHLIEEANHKVRKELKKAFQEMSNNDFASKFLLQVIEALGFNNVEISQQSRDSGKDIICMYKRGLVQSSTIVSLRHWKDKVGPEEIQRLRGIKGEADTGIIFTSTSFSESAILEASPSQNQRSIVLVDGDLIVETFITKNIGVEAITLPILYQFKGFDIDSRDFPETH